MKKKEKSSGRKNSSSSKSKPGDTGTGFFKKVFIVILALFLAALIWYVTLFVLDNASWAVVRIPAIPLPNQASGGDLLYESPVWAVILISFGVGFVLSAFFNMFSKWRLKRRNSTLSKRVGQLQSEIDRLGRLAVASRKKDAASKGQDEDDYEDDEYVGAGEKAHADSDVDEDKSDDGSE